MLEYRLSSLPLWHYPILNDLESVTLRLLAFVTSSLTVPSPSQKSAFLSHRSRKSGAGMGTIVEDFVGIA